MPCSSRSLEPCSSAVWTVTKRPVGFASFLSRRALFALTLHLLGLVMLRQRVDNCVETALHYLVELMQSQTDAMIADSILRKVIGPDLLTAIPGSHHAFPLRANRRLLFFQLD